MFPIAILNASVITADGTFVMRSITLEEARELIRDREIDSAVGHWSTAILLSTLLGREVAVNRQLFSQQVGQAAIVCKLNGRPPEGVALTLEELEEIGYTFKLLERVS